MGKALFFDIDGTLVNFQGEMPESARRALRQVQKNGHRIVLCSGRSRFQIYPWLIDMGFDGIIGAAGAYVECCGRAIYEHHMGRNVLMAARTLLERVGACYAAQTKAGIVISANSKESMISRFRDEGLEEDLADQVWKNVRIDEKLEERHDIEKLFYFDAAETVDRIRAQLSEYCDVVAMSFGIPDGSSGEISARGINKALGMQEYIEYVELAREDTIAFGDGANDFEMLEFAGTGVAMGNAIDALKEKADYVTTGIDEDGIEHALQHMGLLSSIG